MFSPVILAPQALGMDSEPQASPLLLLEAVQNEGEAGLEGREGSPPPRKRDLAKSSKSALSGTLTIHIWCLIWPSKQPVRLHFTDEKMVLLSSLLIWFSFLFSIEKPNKEGLFVCSNLIRSSFLRNPMDRTSNGFCWWTGRGNNWNQRNKSQHQLGRCFIEHVLCARHYLFLCHVYSLLL